MADVTLSEQDWDVVVRALRKATDGFSTDDVADVVLAERAARRVVDRVEAARLVPQT